MYPPDASAAMVKFVRSGRSASTDYKITRFDLPSANDAVAHAVALRFTELA